MFGTTFLIMDIVFMLILIVCSITDIKKRIVPNTCIVLLLVTGVSKIILYSITGYPWWIHVAGLVHTIPFFLAWSKSQMGAGDVKLIMAICLYTGLIISVIFFGFTALVLGIYVMFLYATRKTLNESVPLAPFIALGYLGYIIVKWLIL